MRHVMIILFAAVCLVSLGAGDAPADPQSKPARTALDRYAAAKSKLDAEYQARLSVISRQLLQELQAAVKSATKAGDLKEANAIQAIIDQMLGPAIRIVSAKWGAADATADVTQVIDQAIADNRELLVDNHDMGSDPAPGRQKSLTIRYSVGTTTKDVVIQNGAKFTRDSLK